MSLVCISCSSVTLPFSVVLVCISPFLRLTRLSLSLVCISPSSASLNFSVTRLYLSLSLCHASVSLIFFVLLVCIPPFLCITRLYLSLSLSPSSVSLTHLHLSISLSLVCNSPFRLSLVCISPFLRLTHLHLSLFCISPFLCLTFFSFSLCCLFMPLTRLSVFTELQCLPPGMHRLDWLSSIMYQYQRLQKLPLSKYTFLYHNGSGSVWEGFWVRTRTVVPLLVTS